MWVSTIQLLIHAGMDKQFIMRAGLDDAAVFEDKDTVCVLDGAQAMGNDEGGSAFH